MTYCPVPVLSPHAIEQALDSLMTDPLDTLCAKSAGMKVKKFMSPVNEGNTIKADREIADAIIRLIVEHRISLLVTEQDKVVGFVRVTEVFQFVAERMKACSLYRASEYPRKVGWGHSTIEYAVEVARQAKARSLVLFHHDPGHDDDEVDRMTEAAVELGRSAGLESVTAAAEGMKLTASPRL